MTDDKTIEVLHRGDLHYGGFAGLREHRLVTDRRMWGEHAEPGAWDGLGNFVYFADARFNPKGETHLHPHNEIDVVSVILKGRIAHEGSLEHGTELKTFDVQVQRAGGEGFRHNEVNPDDEKNRMLQLWFTPEEKGAPAGYKLYHPEEGETTLVYGGPTGQEETFASSTEMRVARLREGQSFEHEGPFLAYLALGAGEARGREVNEGDLLRGESLHLSARSDALIIVITERK